MEAKYRQVVSKKNRFIFLLLLFFSSCNRIIDNYIDKQIQQNYTSPYVGKYFGSYNGGEQGSLSITVEKNGNIFGTYGNNNETLSSVVLDNGALLPVNSNEVIFVLYGSLIEKKGTWKKGNLQGTWTLTKQ